MRTLLESFSHICIILFSLQLAYAADLPQIDWGKFTDTFEIISEPRLGKQDIFVPGLTFKGIEFDIRGKVDRGEEGEINPYNRAYHAIFYDMDDIEMGTTSVSLNPKYKNVGWKKGMTGTAFIVLPGASRQQIPASAVKVIKVE